MECMTDSAHFSEIRSLCYTGYLPSLWTPFDDTDIPFELFYVKKKFDESYLQNAEKLRAQTSWGKRGDQNKYLLSRNYMLEMRSWSAMDRQSGSD